MRIYLVIGAICTSALSASSEAAQSPPVQAHVVIYRPSINWASKMFHESVFMDGKRVIKICDDCIYEFDTAAGSHSFQAGNPKNKRGVSPFLSSGSTIFLMVSAENGNLVVKEVPESQAKFEMKQLHQMTIQP